MGVSLWQILNITIPLVLFIAAYFTTARDRYLTRIEFILRFLILLAAGVIITLLASSRSAGGSLGPFVVLLCGLAIGYFNLRFQIMRLQDVRWSPFFALLAYVPVVNLIFLLVLLFVPGKPKMDSDVFS